MENYHFKLLEKVTHKPQTSVGNIPYSFGLQFVDKSLLSAEIDKKFNRNDLQLLIQNPNMIKDMGERLYETVKDTYNLENVTKERASWYKSLIK